MGSTTTHQDQLGDRANGRWLMSLLAIGILLGIGFRFFELGRKLYWHDEAYTSIRAAGFTRQESTTNYFKTGLFPHPNCKNISELNREVQKHTQFVL